MKCTRWVGQTPDGRDLYCDWSPNPNDLRPLTTKGQRYEHAEQADHPLCSVCTRSLPAEDLVVCESCLTRARELLSGISTMFHELPMHLGQPRGNGYDSDSRPAADGRPLPGGDVLVLLARGSEGISDDNETSRVGDTSSVAFDLGFWESTWREARGEPAADLHRPTEIVRRAAGYLETRARWAATNHPAFVAFTQDLRTLHQRLERATGREERLVRAEAECFGCGADALVRQVRPADRCEHEAPSEQLEVIGWTPKKQPVFEPVERRDARLAAWAEEHARCEQGGFENHWTCQRCGDVYDWERYLLAVSNRLQDSDIPGWGLPEQVAYVLGVKPKTVRQWADRALVKSACVVGDKRMRIWWDDARARAEKLKEAARARAEKDEREGLAS